MSLSLPSPSSPQFIKKMDIFLNIKINSNLQNYDK